MANDLAHATQKNALPSPRRAGPAWFLWLGLLTALVGTATALNLGDADPTSASESSELGRGDTITVSGMDSLSLTLDESDGARSVQWNGTHYRDGTEIGGVAVRDKEDGFVLTDGGGTSLRFKAKDDSGYSIRDAAGAVLYRVKVKEDKFNVYDSTGARILYGKEKKGELRLRDADGAEIGRIEGTTDLALAAILAVPIAPELRIAAFVHRVEQLIP